jgi:hypothetical protein
MEPPPIDNDINIYDAVQNAFHIYDNVCNAAPAPNDGSDNLNEATTRQSHGMTNGLERAGLIGSHETEGGDEPGILAAYVDSDIPSGIDDGACDFQSRAQAILEDNSTTPLFADAQLSCLSATLLLLNCLRVHGASNALINELFTLLSKSVLLTANSLPTSEYSASKMLRHLGLGYELIHSCQDACFLGDLEVNCWMHARSVGNRVTGGLGNL